MALMHDRKSERKTILATCLQNEIEASIIIIFSVINIED
jgi:hypothetical protein